MTFADERLNDLRMICFPRYKCEKCPNYAICHELIKKRILNPQD